MNVLEQAILGNSIIWASVIIASAIILKGSGFFSELVPILAGGAAVSLIVLGGARSKLKE